MTQVIASFIVNRLAEYVQLSKDDLHISLRNRTIDAANVALKAAAINRHLPVRLASGILGTLHIQLPTLTSSEPLVVQVRGVDIQLPVDFQRKCDGLRDMDDILSGITADTILGDASEQNTGGLSEATSLLAGAAAGNVAEDIMELITEAVKRGH